MKKFTQIILLSLFGLVFIAAAPSSNCILDTSRNNCADENLSKDHREVKKEFEVKPGGKVTIHLKTGSDIEIKGWDKDLLTVNASIKDDEDNPVEMEFNQNGNDVEITSEYSHRNRHNSSDAKLVLQVPKKFNVEFNTMGGDVSIAFVEGNIEGKTMGGELELLNLKGVLDVVTMGGEITLKDSEVDGKVKTMGGEVLVENVKGDVNASSMGGKVRQINVEGRGKSIGNEVNISTMGGELEIDKAPNGAKLKTMGGDIKVNNVGKFLDAETMGGDIEAKEIDGWIKATTMGGDVDVKMVGDPNDGKRDVTIKSMGGDITLVVPAGLSMDIDIEVVFSKGRKVKSDEDFNKLKIVSDFPVKEERSTEWDYSKGSPRKFLNGTGSVNGGKNKVKITTYNGNVYLKKG